MSLGRKSVQLDLGLGAPIPHIFTVIDLKIAYLILGLDFLSPRKIYPIPHRKILVRDGSNAYARLLDASEIKHVKQVEAGFSTNISVETPNRETPLTPAIDYTTAEEKVRALVSEFPQLTELPDYHTTLKHNHKLDIQLKPSFTPRSCRARPCTLQKKEGSRNKLRRPPETGSSEKRLLTYGISNNYSS